MKTIYLDMDGVLADFNGRIKSLFGKKAENRLSRENWSKFVENKNFETLEMLPSARVLLDFVGESGINTEILGSSGGQQYHEEVISQKKRWLKNHGIKYKANFVPGGLLKADYASPDSLLVDDTPRVIDNFKSRGGNTILHDHGDVKSTIERIKLFIES